MKATKLRSLLVGFFTVVLLFTIGWLLTTKYWKSETGRPSGVQYWINRIGAVGEKAAHDEFVAETEKLKQRLQHEQAHDFGEALYKQGGFKALSVCDNHFAWGCFHQFIGMALSEQGLGAVKELRDACIHTLDEIAVSPDVCIHSLGHGLMAYFGYTREGLDRALDLCKELPNLHKNDPMPECEWGVFMEYSARVMLGEDQTLRKLTDEGVYYPCIDMSGEEQITCLKAQPQWWIRLFKDAYDDNRSLFAHMGALCSALPTASLKDACFEGIGVTAAWDFGQSGLHRKQLCESASHEASDQELCKTHLVYWLWVIWHGQGLATKYTDPVCAGLHGVSFAQCDSFARGQPI